MTNHSADSKSSIHRVIALPLEGASFGANELLDTLRRAVAKHRETDPETADCVLHDVHIQFKKEGIRVVAEFRK